MRPLFTGFFCPNNCDRPGEVAETLGPFGLPVFAQSTLRNPRGLACPYCWAKGAIAGFSKSGQTAGHYNAVCYADNTHHFTVRNDEDRG